MKWTDLMEITSGEKSQIVTNKNDPELLGKITVLLI
jgi:hypothetical protein